MTQNTPKEQWEKEFDKICESKWYYGKPTGWIVDEEDAETLKDFIRKTLHSHTEAVRREERERISKILRDKKRPLWHDDANRHLENVARHNLLDELLQSLEETE